jgi:hypothetical protein
MPGIRPAFFFKRMVRCRTAREKESVFLRLPFLWSVGIGLVEQTFVGAFGIERQVSQQRRAKAQDDADRDYANAPEFIHIWSVKISVWPRK